MMIQIPAMMPQKKGSTPISARKNRPGVIGGSNARRFLEMAAWNGTRRARGMSVTRDRQMA